MQACNGSIGGISQIVTTPLEAGMVGRDDMQKRIPHDLAQDGYESHDRWVGGFVLWSAWLS